MRGLYLCCVYAVLIFAIPSTDAKHYQRYQAVDTLLESLEHEKWSDYEELCKVSTFAVLNAVKNHSTWAVWIWDSMQLPVAVFYGSRYHLGSFEQCLEDPWLQQTTQYCLVDVKLIEDTKPYEEMDPNGDVHDFVGIRTKIGDRRLNFYSMGVCLPAICSPSSVAKISQHIHQLSHLPFGDVTVDPKNCQVKEGQLEYYIGFYVFWFIITITTVIATTVYLVEDSTANPILLKLAKWFSPSKNFKSLTKTNQEEVMSLNGMRAFCAGTAVVCHYYLFVAAFANNPLDIGKILETAPGHIIAQLALVIDAFFMMSGLLLMKRLLTTRSGLVQMLFKRYVRLIAPLALTLLYISAVLPYTVSGPLHPKMVREQSDPCTRNWWLTSLMINNFIRTNEISPATTWYLSCDFQLSALGIIIFWLCQKWKRPGVMKFCMMVYLVSLMIPAVLTYWNELPVVAVFDIDIAIDHNINKVFQTTYIKPYCRTSAFLIGMALGYMMHVYKPKEYRKTISKTQSIFGGILGFLLMFGVMGLGGILNQMKYNALQASVYMAFDRSIFVVGASLLIIVTEYGTFPFIGDFLGSKVFVPLSRLSYGIYLYHPVLLWQNIFSTRAPLTYDFFHMIVNGFGYIVVSCVISYLLWFIVEAPMMNITNSLFRSRINQKHLETKTEVEQNSKKQL